MKYILSLLAVVALAALQPAAQARSLVEIYGGAGLWNGEYDGTLRAGEDFSVDVDDDLDLGRDRHNLFYAGVEHPVPLLPNVRLQYLTLDVSGRSQLERTIEFRGETFTADTEVQSRIDLTQIDGTLYYKLWDTVLSLDLGVTLRYVDGVVEIASEDQSGRADFEGVLPMLHGAARFDLPLTGLWVGGHIDGIAYGGNQLVDLVAAVGWQSSIGLGVEAGWRHYRLQLDDIDDLDRSRLDVTGPFAALNFRF